MSQYAAEYGKQMHDDYATRFRCAVYDQPYGSSSDGRPDCVMPDGKCMILEFKPRTPAAIQKGRAQVARYADVVSRFYKARIDRKEGNDSSPQGSITDRVAKSCTDDGVVEFETDVIDYPLCEKKFECTR